MGWLWDTAAGPWALTMTGTWKRLLESDAAALATLNASERESQDFLLKMEFTSWITWSCDGQGEEPFTLRQHFKYLQKVFVVNSYILILSGLNYAPLSGGAPCPHDRTGHTQQKQTMLWPPTPPQTEDTLHPDHLNVQRDPTMKINIQKSHKNTKKLYNKKLVTQCKWDKSEKFEIQCKVDVFSW